MRLFIKYFLSLTIPGLLLYWLLFYTIGSNANSIGFRHNSKSSEIRPFSVECDKPEIRDMVMAYVAKHKYWYYEPEKIKFVFNHYSKLPEYMQFELITKLTSNKTIPEKILSLFNRELKNKSLTEIMRNNIAMALVRQYKHDYSLEAQFYQMFCDQHESDKWRAYCIQFYAECSLFSKAPQNIYSKLKNITSNKNDTFAVTAIVGIVNYREVFELSDEEVMDFLIAKHQFGTTSPHLRACIYGAFGQLDDKRGVALIRKTLKQISNKYELISAIGTLGHKGVASDINLITPLYETKDQDVKEVVEYNLKKLIDDNNIIANKR